MTLVATIVCPVCRTPSVTATGRATPGSNAWNWQHVCDAGRGSRSKDDYVAICDALDDAARFAVGA